MKKLLSILFLIAIAYSCNGPTDDKKKPEDKLPEIPQKILPDILLEDSRHDSMQMTMRRRPRTKPPVIDTSGTSTYIPPTILLDFDGHVTKGTMWNVYGDIVAEESGLTPEQQKVVFDSVVSYFKQFKNPIFITTDEAKFLKVPINERRRGVITKSVFSQMCTNCGGIAYLNSFIWGTDEPFFVFSYLHGYRVRNIGDAFAHEAAHTLGNRHQATWVNGVKTGDYNWGDGVRAPITGASYNVSIPTFCWVGLNSANQMQNDTATMQSKF